MNLEKLIKPYFEEYEVVNYRGIKRKEKRIPIEKLGEIEKNICAWFKKQGWKNKQYKYAAYYRSGNFNQKVQEYVAYRYVSRKEGHHTKIHWQVGEKHVMCSLKVKTETSSWKQNKIGSCYSPNLKSWVAQALKIKAPSIISKSNLPEPLKFDSTENTLDFRDGDMALNLSIFYARVLGVYGLSPQGTLDKKEIYNPKEKVWFYMRCVTPRQSTHFIITDGDIFHMINKKSRKLRVTGEIPKDMKDCSYLDKMVVESAIAKFWELQENA
jgi:hypothetical protein